MATSLTYSLTQSKPGSIQVRNACLCTILYADDSLTNLTPGDHFEIRSRPSSRIRDFRFENLLKFAKFIKFFKFAEIRLTILELWTDIRLVVLVQYRDY